MDSPHSVLVTAVEEFERFVEVEDLRGITSGVLTAEGVPKAELGVLVTDDEAVRRLNAEYAGEDEATDVLAFSLREGEEFVWPDGVVRLGEVIISYPTASRQAAEAGRLVDEEIAHLLVHGILHLLGYDHAEAEDERKMRAREEELLALRH
ncbi:MAG TPA: rRNA maturation RNase YbeY [Dehalococcoidia bacterium]|jgi:probable rRNA maturation factor|nr:rRNA maturation RNase YbeY [Dehalococcoidia bacterium]